MRAGHKNSITITITIIIIIIMHSSHCQHHRELVMSAFRGFPFVLLSLSLSIFPWKAAKSDSQGFAFDSWKIPVSRYKMVAGSMEHKGGTCV